MENETPVEFKAEGGERERDYLLPASILVAALLISGSIIYLVGAKTGNQGGTANLKDNTEVQNATGISKVKPVTSDDHILGNPNAPVKIIEFSDLECPFCKTFHATMHQIVTAYDGKVAWIYRNFPIDSLHPKAREEALAAECANELGGNTKFWAYIDKVFEVTPSNNGLDLGLLPKIAEDLGLNQAKFKACLSEQKHMGRIDADIKDVMNTLEPGERGLGTPRSIVIGPNGKTVLISGAQPLSEVRLVIDGVLSGN
ncbi:MAG: thioredoxin domain-containing protein [Patescibacteria group bacterium]